MSNSSLANYVNRIVGNYFYRDEYISAIVIHDAGEAGDIYTLAEFLASGTTGYHYGIDDDGTIGLFVDEMYGVSASGDDRLDNIAVQIIVMENDSDVPSLQEGDRISSLTNLVEDICRRNYILKLEENINFFNEGPHISVSEINERLTGARQSSETEALKAQSSIAVGAIKPFMAVIDPTAKPEDFDCEALRDIGVVGYLMYAGSLYNSNHVMTKPYKSATLKAQMEKVIQSRSHWALLTISRARTLQEAKEEIYWFYFVIAKYPPKLGVWVQPEFDKSVTEDVAHEIIELYYKYFVRWGLIDKCGIYCTKSQAEKIGWEDFADRMSLWLNEPLGGVECLEQVLTPSLFKLEEEE